MVLKHLVRVYKYKHVGFPDVDIGTAYPIAHERILVARHVLSDNDQEIDLTKIELTLYRHLQEDGKRIKITPSDVLWDGGGTDKLDAVILKCPFPDGISVRGDILSDRCPQLNEVWSSEGFPEAGRIEDAEGIEKLEPHPLKGTTHPCSEGDRTFQLIVDGPPTLSGGWKGVSGAPVFVEDRILGIITEVRENFGGTRLWAIPMFRLLAQAEFCQAIGSRHKSPVERQFVSSSLIEDANDITHKYVSDRARANSEAQALYELGVQDMAEHRYREAGLCFVQAFNLIDQDFSPQRLRYLHQAAVAHHMSGNIEEAGRLFSAALDLFPATRVFEIDIIRAHVLSDYSDLLLQAHQYNKSEETLWKAREIVRLHFDDSCIELAIIETRLLRLYDKLGRYQDAEKCGRSALRIFDLQQEGLDNHLEFLADYASYWEDIGSFDLAESLFLKALALLEGQKGKSPLMADYLNYFGKFLLTIGRFAEAEETTRKALELRKRIYPDNPEKIAETHNNLAMIYITTMRYKSAEHQLRIAKKLLETISVESSITYQYVRNNLAIIDILYGHWLKWFRAAYLLSKAARALTSSSTINHRLLGIINVNFGTLFLRYGNTGYANKYFNEAYDIFTTSNVNPTHPDMLQLFVQQARACTQDRNYKRAEHLLRRATEGYREIFSNGHPGQGDAFEALGYNSVRSGKNLEAIEQLSAAVNIFDSFFGPKHIRVAQTLHLLSVAYLSNNEKTNAIKIMNKIRDIVDTPNELGNSMDYLIKSAQQKAIS